MIFMKAQYNQKTESSIQDTIILKKIKLDEAGVIIKIPEELSFMDKVKKDSFYPYENRPEMILSDSEGKVQISFQLFDKELRNDQTMQAVEEVRKCTGFLYPWNALSPSYMHWSGECPVGWFFMKMELNNMSVYHIKAVRTVREKLFLITMTYPEAEYLKWQIVLKYIFDTLQEVDK